MRGGVRLLGSEVMPGEIMLFWPGKSPHRQKKLLGAEAEELFVGRRGWANFQVVRFGFGTGFMFCF